MIAKKTTLRNTLNPQLNLDHSVLFIVKVTVKVEQIINITKKFFLKKIILNGLQIQTFYFNEFNQ